jgi:membrane protease YdiL (CAAX protease family)
MNNMPRPLWQRYTAVILYLIASAALVQIIAVAYFALHPALAAGLRDKALPFRFLTQTVIIQMIAFLLPAPMLLKFTRANAFTFRRTAAREIILCCSLIFASLIFFSVLYQYLHIEPDQLGFLDGADILRHKAAFIVVTAVAVPGYEEWVFRGLIFGILVTEATDTRQVLLAGATSALIFTASHFEGKHSISALPPILVMAGIFQYMTWRSQSLWPAVCGHAMQNFLSSVAFFAKFSAEAAK